MLKPRWITTQARLRKYSVSLVSGVSGSGKTTLLLESMYPAIKSYINGEDLPDNVIDLECEDIKKIELIDSVPIGKNVRSTVATYSKVLDDLRREFAKLSDEYKMSDFSYNTGKLRCETCNGTGNVSMDVQFLPDVEMTCPDCNGLRYDKKVEDIKYNGLSIADVMNLTIDEALEELFELKKVTGKLQKLSDLGLGYLTLGLPKRNCLLISWLQSPSAVILEPRKIKSDTVSTVSPILS